MDDKILSDMKASGYDISGLTPDSSSSIGTQQTTPKDTLPPVPEPTPKPTWETANVSQKFGNQNRRLYGSQGHLGTDFSVAANTPLNLPDGNWEVESVYPNSRRSLYGNSVLVKNKDTSETLRFSHLNSIGVKPGQELSSGDVIGKSGSTGRSTGPHLDLEFRDANGKLGDVTQSDIFVPKSTKSIKPIKTEDPLIEDMRKAGYDI